MSPVPAQMWMAGVSPVPAPNVGGRGEPSPGADGVWAAHDSIGALTPMRTVCTRHARHARRRADRTRGTLGGGPTGRAARSEEGRPDGAGCGVGGRRTALLDRWYILESVRSVHGMARHRAAHRTARRTVRLIAPSTTGLGLASLRLDGMRCAWDRLAH